MSIHILTQDAEAKSQLKLLMGDVDQKCTFHQAVATLEKVLPRLKKTDSVFYDLKLEDTLWAFERLYTGCRKTHLVAFEQLTDETGTDGHQSPMGVENYFLLSPNASRAKTRLSAVLQELAKKSVKRKAKKKAKKTAKKRTTATTPTNATPTAPIGKADSTRYLQGQSDAMQAFAAELKVAAAGKHQFIMLQGEDGAEFELAARELNFQANADLSPLIVLDPMHLKYEELEQIEAQAKQFKSLNFG